MSILDRRNSLCKRSIRVYDIFAEWLGLMRGGQGTKNLDHQHSNSTIASETFDAHWQISLGWPQTLFL